MANPIQQGLKHEYVTMLEDCEKRAAMANPIQQGLKRDALPIRVVLITVPQWLIQYNKD